MINWILIKTKGTGLISEFCIRGREFRITLSGREKVGFSMSNPRNRYALYFLARFYFALLSTACDNLLGSTVRPLASARLYFGGRGIWRARNNIHHF